MERGAIGKTGEDHVHVVLPHPRAPFSHALAAAAALANCKKLIGLLKPYDGTRCPGEGRGWSARRRAGLNIAATAGMTGRRPGTGGGGVGH